MIGDFGRHRWISLADGNAFFFQPDGIIPSKVFLAAICFGIKITSVPCLSWNECCHIQLASCELHTIFSRSEATL